MCVCVCGGGMWSFISVVEWENRQQWNGVGIECLAA